MNKNKFVLLTTCIFISSLFSIYSNFNHSLENRTQQCIFKTDGCTKKQFLSNNIYNYSIEPVYDVVQTPNGNDAVVQVNEELFDAEILSLNATTNQAYPDAIMLRGATNLYNCHSYAWYSQSINNIYWMNNPSKYYEDLSYIETNTPEIGDIVCYFSDNWTIIESDDLNLHSGIIVGTNNNQPNSLLNSVNTFVVESKWGNLGLYRHTGNYCPYVIEGNVSYIKYYKRHESHSYNFSYEWVDYTKHLASCECGEEKQMSHVVQAGSSTGMYKTCLLCGGLARTGIIHFSTRFLKMSKNGSYILPNGVIVLVDQDMELFFKGELIFE